MDIAKLFEMLAKVFGEFQVNEPEEEFDPLFPHMSVLVDPGHGLYKTVEGVWNFQRDEWFGVIEDTQVMKITEHLVPLLRPLFRKVHVTRPLMSSPTGMSIGESGHPRWKEGALYYLRSILDGHPAQGSVCEIGSKDRYKDINCRPLYAEHLSVDIILGVHINASDTNHSARGMEVLYREGDAESKKLSQCIHDGLVGTEFDTGRGLKGRKSDLSFFRRSTMPSALMEFLFFTNAGDSGLLSKDENLRKCAEAMANGTAKYLRNEVSV